MKKSILAMAVIAATSFGASASSFENVGETKDFTRMVKGHEVTATCEIMSKTDTANGSYESNIACTTDNGQKIDFTKKHDEEKLVDIDLAKEFTVGENGTLTLVGGIDNHNTNNADVNKAAILQSGDKVIGKYELNDSLEVQLISNGEDSVIRVNGQTIKVGEIDVVNGGNMETIVKHVKNNAKTGLGMNPEQQVKALNNLSKNMGKDFKFEIVDGVLTMTDTVHGTIKEFNDAEIEVAVANGVEKIKAEAQKRYVPEPMPIAPIEDMPIAGPCEEACLDPIIEVPVQPVPVTSPDQVREIAVERVNTVLDNASSDEKIALLQHALNQGETGFTVEHGATIKGDGVLIVTDENGDQYTVTAQEFAEIASAKQQARKDERDHEKAPKLPGEKAGKARDKMVEVITGLAESGQGLNESGQALSDASSQAATTMAELYAATDANTLAISDLYNQIDRLDEKMDGVMAGTHAVNNARPFLSGEGQTAVGVGVGYAGESGAVAIGAAHSFTENWSASATLNVTTGSYSEVSGGAGVQYVF